MHTARRTRGAGRSLAHCVPMGEVSGVWEGLELRAAKEAAALVVLVWWS